MLPKLTEREKRILFYIRMFQYEHGYSPSNQDIGDYFLVGKQTISDVTIILKKKGYIEMSPHKLWQRKRILFPRGCTFPWGSETLPEELFEHMMEKPTIENN